MNVLLCGDIDAAEMQVWRRELAAAMPEAQWLDISAARARPDTVLAAVVANPQPGSLAGLPGLRLIQSLWAGVDRLLGDASLPAAVPLARMVDPAMNAAMAETALWATLAMHRGFFAYARRQQQARWQPHGQRRADELRVSVLGLGQMGASVALRLAQQGYVVTGWTRSARAGSPAGVTVVRGDDALAALLPVSDIVINLLPLTAETRGLINADWLAALPALAGLVNLGRGAHVVEADLLAALDSGRLGHAVLDVFQTEPLPADHAFWRHPRVTVLPHAAAMTDPRSAAAVAVANLRAARDGRPLAHLVERARGY